MAPNASRGPHRSCYHSRRSSPLANYAIQTDKPASSKELNMSNTLLRQSQPAPKNPHSECVSVKDGPQTTWPRWLHGLRVGLIVFAALLLSLTALGASYQAIASAIDSARYSAPGHLVDVGGYRLHLNCTGSGS